MVQLAEKTHHVHFIFNRFCLLKWKYFIYPSRAVFFADSFIISITQTFLSSFVSPNIPPGNFNVSILYLRLGSECVISSTAEKKRDVEDIK